MTEDMTEMDWADIEDQWVDTYDDEHPVVIPDVSEANLDLISRMMAAMRRLQESIAEYDRLDAIERRRLDTQRERAIGPRLRRLEHLDTVVTDYAVKSFLDFGKTRLATPNGSITSNATKPKLVVDDEIAGQFFESTERVDLITWNPKVPVGDLRDWLDTGEANGEIVRCICVDDGESISEIDLPPGHVYKHPFGPGETGRYRVLGEDAARVISAFHGAFLPGVFWEPTGTGSTGRNFHVKPA